jgi:hypothetical protein
MVPNDEPYRKRLRYLDLSLEKGTPAVPDDGRYHVLSGTEIRYSSANLALARAHLELLEEELKATHPELKDPREVLRNEQAFNDVLAVRGEGRRRARTQQDAKGGKGGRSGV